ncbi:hypothetical protein NL676_034713 [Syzygium grande]|nr:hypothetical protein NL676_034713 [Syzygium grande]
MTFLNLVMAVSVAPSMSMAGFRPPEKEDDGDDKSWPASSAAVGGGRRHLYEILDALYQWRPPLLGCSPPSLRNCRRFCNPSLERRRKVRFESNG